MRVDRFHLSRHRFFQLLVSALALLLSLSGCWFCWQWFRWHHLQERWQEVVTEERGLHNETLPKAILEQLSSFQPLAHERAQLAAWPAELLSEEARTRRAFIEQQRWEWSENASGLLTLAQPLEIDLDDLLYLLPLLLPYVHTLEWERTIGRSSQNEVFLLHLETMRCSS